jgi:hypothetical protein
MRKWSVIIPLMIISCMAIGCGGGPEETQSTGIPDNKTVVRELMRNQQPILEITPAQQKTEEEQAKQIEAEELALARSNPFLTKEEEEAFKESQGRVPIKDMNLSAIMYSPPNSKVIVDGAILKEGDNIGTKKIIEIQPKMVIFKDETTKLEYTLKTTGAAESDKK